MSASLTGDVLDAETFPPLVWPVPGIVPEGLGILASAPKVGKSWLALLIGLGVARGDKVLGVRVDQRPVLYLALEDGWRRLQNRCRKLLDDSPIPPGITFHIDRTDALDKAKEFVEHHGGAAPLVILDTIGKVKPSRPRSTDAYSWDYNFTSGLKEIATQGATLLGIHHDRKAESEDFLHDVSGTNGITGAADFVMVLKRPRLGRQGKLLVTGREVAEDDFAMVFLDGRWTIDGDELGRAAEQAKTLQLGTQMRRVLDLVQSRDETTASDVARLLKMEEDTAGRYLRRLANDHGAIGKRGRGVYEPLSKVSDSASSPGLSEASHTGQPDTTDTAPYDEMDFQPLTHSVTEGSISSAIPTASSDSDVESSSAEAEMDTSFSPPGPPQADHEPAEVASDRCEVPGCGKLKIGWYGGMSRCYPHAEAWKAEEEKRWSNSGHGSAAVESG
ncbi:AAA family ATPase [Mycobacterium intracellulare]|uniref:AAA family ATPase n=1 Tax=Mycobacterium intracellulare TaxID=1767 RepID=UPI0009F586D7|nr:AAA family ATPase [Mycobacterium intracellulare]